MKRIIPEPVKQILDEVNGAPPAHSAAERRKGFAKLSEFSGEARPTEIKNGAFTARDGATIKTRSYGKGAPLMLYFHGGGYVAGGLKTHHAALTQLAQYWPGEIRHVDYRRAPEHRYPQALHDAQDALALANENVFVAGDSAGGNLAAVLSLTHPENIRGQILLYPTLDAFFKGESWQELPSGYIASAKDSGEFNKLYARSEADFADPLFSPVYATKFDRTPPAWFFAGDLDPARSDTETYARLLAKHGIQAQVTIVPGLIHGFITMSAKLAGTTEVMKAIGTIAHG